MEGVLISLPIFWSVIITGRAKGVNKKMENLDDINRANVDSE